MAPVVVLKVSTNSGTGTWDLGREDSGREDSGTQGSGTRVRRDLEDVISKQNLNFALNL